MSTIKDVAQRADVAPSTVSKYLNGGCVRSENSDAIREAIAELEYRVNPFARSLKTQRSRFVAVHRSTARCLRRSIRCCGRRAIIRSSHATAPTTASSATISSFF